MTVQDGPAGRSSQVQQQEKVLQGLWRELRKNIASVYQDPASLSPQDVPRLHRIVHE